MLNYITSRTVSKLLQIIGQIFAVTEATSFNALVRGTLLNSELRNLAQINYERRSVVWSEKYFDILNRLGVDNDDRIERQIESPLAIAQSNSI